MLIYAAGEDVHVLCMSPCVSSFSTDSASLTPVMSVVGCRPCEGTVYVQDAPSLFKVEFNDPATGAPSDVISEHSIFMQFESEKN